MHNIVQDKEKPLWNNLEAFELHERSHCKGNLDG